MKGDDQCCSDMFLHGKNCRVKKAIEQSRPEWSSLPDHIITDIGNRLHSRIDINLFRAVCSTFLKAVPRPSKTLFPQLSFPIPAPIGPSTNTRAHFSVTESTVYAIEPRINGLPNAKPWLVKVQELENGKVLLKDFLSRYYFKNLPTKCLPNSLNLVEFKVKELKKSYELQLTLCNVQHKGLQVDHSNTTPKPFLLQKVIVTSAHNETDVGFAVMTIHDGGTVDVWRKGDGSWSNIHFGERNSFEDMIYYKKSFYVLDHQAQAIAVDPQTLHIVEVAGPMPNMGLGFRYFLESCGKLYLIIKYWSSNYPKVRPNNQGGMTEYPVYLEVYKLDEENHEWLEVTTELEDRVVFLGDDCSFTVPVDELPGCEGNCVFFGDIVFAEDSNDHPGWHVGVYNLSNGTVVAIRDYPNYPNMFWPPPRWLRQESTSACF